MFVQDLKKKPIRDFVFPLGFLRDGKFELAGTAFFVGGQGVAVTAGHVVREITSEASPMGLFATDTSFEQIEILHAECHPTEDVGVVKLAGNWHSMIEVEPSVEHSSCRYQLWGYPETVAHEIRRTATNQEDAASLVRPDLIYNEGYIRRRISEQLPVSVFQGEAFYELSEVGGSCCSGAPIIRASRAVPGPWQAIGVYVGEETGRGPTSVGYATRSDALIEWRPSLLGASLSEQKATIRS